ncbi:MAG: hypothetical protein K2W80_10950 [Burkholderiales bacterium]|nr:hypothetical protein [Burkholderiales bacterium]
MTTLDTLPPAERQRLQRRNSVRMALVLAVVAVLVFSGYIYQVARMAA